jgi:hypothetical protein
MPLNLRFELRKRARPKRGGLSGTREGGWIIELGVVRKLVCPLRLGMDKRRLARIDEKMTKSKLLPSHH